MKKIIVDTPNTISIDDIPNTAIIVFDLKADKNKGILIPSKYFGYIDRTPIRDRTYFARVLDYTFMYGNSYILKDRNNKVGTIQEWVNNFNINDVNDAIFYVLDSLEELVKFYNKTI